MKFYLKLRQLEHEANRVARPWSMSTLFFFGSIALIPLLPTGFIPPGRQLADPGLYRAAARIDAGADPQAAAEQARVMIAKVEHVKSVYTTIGGGSAGGDPVCQYRARPRRARPRSPSCLADRSDRPRKQGIENKIRAALESSARCAQQGGPGRLR